jgi:uncharacterized membrane protein
MQRSGVTAPRGHTGGIGMGAHDIWQLISHYSFFILTILGSIIVLGLVYRSRQKQRQRETE